MKTIIRITGMVNMNRDSEETLSRLRLRRKYSCVVINENKEIMGMLKKVRNFVAYGEIDKETLKEMIIKRGKSIEGDKKKLKISDDKASKLAEEIIKKQSLNNLEIKPFFRLHPPRKGINTRDHFPKGVLGDNKDKINELIRRML
ncbi:50S ribosomal protein L30 [Candidatus Pacearchaeota archaeon]|nr:50S ribosomal protein L30 [Candidatus Pacearchaeota archaeon]